MNRIDPSAVRLQPTSVPQHHLTNLRPVVQRVFKHCEPAWAASVVGRAGEYAVEEVVAIYDHAFGDRKCAVMIGHLLVAEMKVRQAGT